MMTSQQLSILVTGNLCGRTSKVFERVELLVQKHGRPFDMWFCLGDMLSPSMTLTDRAMLEAILDGSQKGSLPIPKPPASLTMLVPMPLYFVLRDGTVGVEEELIKRILLHQPENVKILDLVDVMQLQDGLTVGFISGVEDRPIAGRRSLALTRHLLSSTEIEKFERKLAGRTLDLLLTFEWPLQICEHSSTAAPGYFSLGSRILGQLMHRIEARYHFAIGENLFFEREPYENMDRMTGKFKFATRFISLAEALSSSQRWYYAFNIRPIEGIAAKDDLPSDEGASPPTKMIKGQDQSITKRPSNITPSPFTTRPSITSKSSLPTVEPATPNYFFAVGADSKRPYSTIEADALAAAQAGVPVRRGPPPEGYVCKRCHSSLHYYRDCPYKEHLPPGSSASRPQYICHVCHQPGHHIKNCPKRLEQHASSKIDLSTCWFCLSNPAIRKHLIVWIGELVYLTLAKGALTEDHLILIPIEHISSLTRPSEEVWREMARVQEVFYDLLTRAGKTPVYFTIHQNVSHHWHLQCIGIATDRMVDFESFLKDYAVRLGYHLTAEETRVKRGPQDGVQNEVRDQVQDEARDQIRDEIQDQPQDQSYDQPHDQNRLVSSFRISFNQTTLTYPIPEGSFFPAQFGRQAIGEFLQLGDEKSRRDWRSASLSDEAEMAMVAEIKERLKPLSKLFQKT